MGPSGLVEAIAAKAAEGMKVVIVQGADKETAVCTAAFRLFG